MGKKLLLLTDFSKHSWNAIQYAIRLYKHRQCDFYILNTYKRDSYGFDSITLDPEDALNKLYENRSKEGLGDILNWIYQIENYFGHRFYVISRPGPLLNAVKDIVLNQEIDMVFMGAKGMDNEQKNKYGKNTMDVIQNVRRCPIMVVPNSVTLGLPKEIFLAINFNADFDFSKIEPLAEMARLTRAKVKVLSFAVKVSSDHQQKKNKIRLQKYFEGVDFSFHTLLNINMKDALSNLEVGSENMISYVDEYQSFWERFGFGKPTLDKLGYYKNVPVLALHG